MQRIPYLSDLRLSVDLAGEDCPEGMKCCTYEPDPLAHDRVSARFFNEILATMETLHVYDGRYHEIYNESEDLWRQVLKDLEDWLEKRLGMTIDECGMTNGKWLLTIF